MHLTQDNYFSNVGGNLLPLVGLRYMDVAY